LRESLIATIKANYSHELAKRAPSRKEAGPHAAGHKNGAAVICLLCQKAGNALLYIGGR
jgi:hypothetical protein